VLRKLVVVALTPVLVGCGSTSTSSAPAGPPKLLTVFAAASLQPPFDRIATAMKAKHVVDGITFNYAGSQTLTAQLTQGASADVFASADLAHMTTVQSAGLLAGAPQIFAHNRLEIAVEHGNPKHIQSLADLGRPGLVIVLADPSVPAGKYAQQALTRAHVTVHPASLELQVTGVLAKVALGEADAGIVYVSDITTSGRVDGVVIPDPQNVIADYPIAALAGSQSSALAAAFIAFVLSAAGQEILKGAGFQGV
jgi:molybdate transport system substrate-binding protein